MELKRHRFVGFLIWIQIFVAILIVQSSCYSAKKARREIRGKILGFSTKFSGDSKRNGFAIYKKEDSLIWIERPAVHGDIVRFYDTTSGSEKGLYRESILYALLSSEVPFHLKKNGSIIFISYFKQGIPKTQRHYSLRVKDTINIIDMSDLCDESGLGWNKGQSYYTGRDTTIRFDRIKFRCYIFEEVYLRRGHSLPTRRKKVYLEKGTLLPVKIHSSLEYGEYSEFGRQISGGSYNLNFIVEAYEIINSRSDIQTKCK